MEHVKAPYRRPARDEVRERILAAAATVFADKGFSGARIDDIAAAAGFTKGAVYSNFATKDELFFALMDRQVAQRAELAGEILRRVPLDPAAIGELGERLTEAIAANRDWQLLFIEYWQRALRDEEVRARFAEHRRAVRTALAEEIQRQFAAAGIRTALPVSGIVFALLGLSNGLAIEELADPGCVPRELLGELLALGLGSTTGSDC